MSKLGGAAGIPQGEDGSSESGVGGNWRSGPAYDYFDELDPEEIAFEFLRRNNDYATEYAHLPEAPAEPPPALTSWGLRFRGRPPPPRRSSDHRLAAGAESETGVADAAFPKPVRRP